MNGIVPKRLPTLEGAELWLVEGRGCLDDRETLYEFLSADEQERVSRFKFEDAHDAAIVSRGVLRRILGRVLKCAPEALEFGEGEHGKPFLAGRHSRSGIEFNVAHSGEVVLYAVSGGTTRSARGAIEELGEPRTELGSMTGEPPRGRVVGVDVELKKESLDVEKMALRYFAPGESRSLLQIADAEERRESFYRCWTRKEAYLKARGTGLTTQLDAFEVTLLAGVPPALLHTEAPGEDPTDWAVIDIPVPRGYVAALVVGK